MELVRTVVVLEESTGGLLASIEALSEVAAAEAHERAGEAQNA